mmetsp:Transcript_2194/g.4370  ORF Transcript_2194/g.4370 Transcript_2194/m.4370 type:complete len:97 (+) Transcript_2194:595-885(+)
MGRRFDVGAGGNQLQIEGEATNGGESTRARLQRGALCLASAAVLTDTDTCQVRGPVPGAAIVALWAAPKILKPRILKGPQLFLMCDGEGPVSAPTM